MTVRRNLAQGRSKVGYAVPEITIQKSAEPDCLNFDSTQNLVGFFALLLEIDRRTQSERYRSK